MYPVRTIINADDFGWDDDSTQAILELASNERISSTTVMANLVQYDELKALKQFQNISVGLHLNLIDGLPLSQPHQVSTIINPQTGNFYPANILWMRVLQGKVCSKHISQEVTSQVQMLRDHGIAISHADSHQHIHIFPGLSQHITNCLKANHIHKIRNCNIPEFYDTRRFVIKVFNQIAELKCKKVDCNNKLISAFSIYQNIDLEMFKKKVLPVMLSNKLTELMVHPAKKNKEGSYMQRKSEFDFLKQANWKDLLAKNKIQLIGWDKV